MISKFVRYVSVIFKLAIVAECWCAVTCFISIVLIFGWGVKEKKRVVGIGSVPFVGERLLRLMKCRVYRLYEYLLTTLLSLVYLVMITLSRSEPTERKY